MDRVNPLKRRGPSTQDDRVYKKAKKLVDLTTCIKSQLESDNNLILSSTVVENVGKDTTGIVNKNTRNLVDYSEIVVHGNSREPAKQATAVIGSDSSLRRSGRVRTLESNLRNCNTRNQDR
nr:hypothetical protein [Tanacetum cinerariifolium]